MTGTQKGYYSAAMDKKIRNRFYGHDVLYGRYERKVSPSAEREYMRLMNRCCRALKESLLEELPAIQEEYRRQTTENVRLDAQSDFWSWVEGCFLRIRERTLKKLEKVGVLHALNALFGTATWSSINEWHKQVKDSIGVNLDIDYYNGAFYQDIMDKWVSDNVELIKTVPDTAFERMKKIIKDGYMNGKSTTRITREIEAAYGMERRHARFIVQDQMAKLNADITKKQFEDAGCTKFRWSDSGDARVRASHRRLNGHVFDINNPLETDNGRHCLPGQDYGCRCVMGLVLERGKINIPIKENTDAI